MAVVGLGQVEQVPLRPEASVAEAPLELADRIRCSCLEVGRLIAAGSAVAVALEPEACPSPISTSAPC